MTKTELSHEGQKDCIRSAFYLIPALREVAESLGYALAVHGSLSRDIDLIACPWTSEAVEPRVLAEAIQKKAIEINGFAFPLHNEDEEYNRAGCPGAKPHGRLTWVYHLGGGPYIDLSVMPLLIETQKQELERMAKLTGQDFSKLIEGLD